MAGRIVGSELIEDARQRGRIVFEVLPDDIITALARETAERLGIKLVNGPIEKPAAVRTDGQSAMRRGLYRRGAKWVAPRRSLSATTRRFTKIGLIGAGGVGTNIAHLAAMSDMADEITLVDIAPGIAAATALDLNHASGITRSRARCIGSEDLSAISGSDVVVVTAGRARTPGMSRSDLIQTNARVIRSAGEAIKTVAPHAIALVVTNPLDEMTVEMLRATGFPRERVLGMAGTLDSSRFRHALARAAGVTPADVEAITLGSHGEEMAPIPSLARIKGRALTTCLSEDQINACVQEAVTGGGQVVALKKSGSATIAPAHATIEIMNHLRGALGGSVPVSVMLKGEYGISDVVLGVPAHLGQSGLLEVEELRLSEQELTALRKAAGAIKERIGING